MARTKAKRSQKAQASAKMQIRELGDKLAAVHTELDNYRRMWNVELENAKGLTAQNGELRDRLGTAEYRYHELVQQIVGSLTRVSVSS